MFELVRWLRELFGGTLPWVIIPPWCVGVRVRLGRRAVQLNPGPHLRVPFLDHVELVNTRARLVTGAPVVRAGERPGWVRARTAQCVFRVADPVSALLTFSSPEQIVRGFLVHVAAEFDEPDAALAWLTQRFEGSGLLVVELTYTEQAEVRVLKLMQGSATDVGYYEAPTHGGRRLY